MTPYKKQNLYQWVDFFQIFPNLSHSKIKLWMLKKCNINHINFWIISDIKQSGGDMLGWGKHIFLSKLFGLGLGWAGLDYNTGYNAFWKFYFNNFVYKCLKKVTHIFWNFGSVGKRQTNIFFVRPNDNLCNFFCFSLELLWSTKRWHATF